MNSKGLVALVAGLVILLGAFYFLNNEVEAPTDNTDTQTSDIDLNYSDDKLSDEKAEEVGFGFIQDFIKTAPPEPSTEAQQRAYDALSETAKTNVSIDTISRDLAAFVGVQDVPDQGASVEDLQIVSSDEAFLVVGLNYSGGRVLKQINLVAENGEWKVDSVETLQDYP